MTACDDLFRSFRDLCWHLDPAAATLAGAPGFDGRLAPLDAGSVRAHLAAFRAIEAGIEELSVEDPAAEVDRTALLDEVRVAIFRLQHERPHQRNPAFWLLHLCRALWSLAPRQSGGGGDGASGGGRRAGEREQALLERLRAVPGFLRTAAGTLDQPLGGLVEIAGALRAVAMELCREFARAFRELADDGALRWSELAEAAVEAEAALARFGLTLDAGGRAGGTERPVGVGERQFERLLHYDHAVNASAAEVWRFLLGLEEETEAQLDALAAQLGAGEDWRAVVARRVREAAARPPVAARFSEELRRAGEFAVRHALVSTRPDPLDVVPLPGWLVPVTLHAAYLPGPADAVPRLLLSTEPVTGAFVPVLAVEVGVPGLHLQHTVAGRLPEEIRRHPASTLADGGWGLYAVEVMDEAGYWCEPADRLLARAHVLVRVLVARADVGIHTGQFTPESALALLVERLPLDESVLRRAVWGACLEPTRATGALLGRRELLALRDERRGAAGGGFSLCAHHDAVLRWGGLPAPLVRWGLEMEG